MMNFVLKTRNSVLKTRNCVLKIMNCVIKTRLFVLSNDEFCSSMQRWSCWKRVMATNLSLCAD